MLKEKQTVKQYRRYIELFCSLVVVCFLYALHVGNLKTAVDDDDKLTERIVLAGQGRDVKCVVN